MKGKTERRGWRLIGKECKETGRTTRVPQVERAADVVRERKSLGAVDSDKYVERGESAVGDGMI